MIFSEKLDKAMSEWDYYDVEDLFVDVATLDVATEEYADIPSAIGVRGALSTYDGIGDMIDHMNNAIKVAQVNGLTVYLARHPDSDYYTSEAFMIIAQSEDAAIEWLNKAMGDFSEAR